MQISPTPSAVPAAAVAQELSWLATPGSAFSKVEVVGDDVVRITVPDSEYHDEGWMADMATEGLRDSIEGVKLLFVDETGRAGQRQGFSGDELIDLYTGIPGVRDYANILFDLDGDGTARDDEGAHVFQVAESDVERVASVVPMTIGDEPVVFTPDEI